MQISPEISESSVMFSLAELTRLEEERQREDEQQRVRAQAAQLQARRQAAEVRRQAEEARLQAELDRQREQERQQQEAAARAEAQAAAAIEVARIEAEAKAQLVAANAARAHELSVLELRTSRGQVLERWTFGVIVGLLATASAVGLYRSTTTQRELEGEISQLKQQHQQALDASAQLQANQLAALDRHYAILRARPLAHLAADALRATDAARAALNHGSPDRASQVVAFEAALGAFEQRLHTLERRTALDQRYTDLAAWSARQRGRTITQAYVAATQAKTRNGHSASELAVYEQALDRLRAHLGGSSPTTPSMGPAPAGPASEPARERECPTGDPMCGWDGRIL